MRWDIDPINQSTGLPLEGVRVLDLSRVLAGPLCAMIAGDLGADVVKIEGPDGDPVRQLAPPRFEGDATYFLAVNRHRRFVSLDLRKPSDVERLSSLVAQADAVVENYLPHQSAAYGIDALRDRHPDVVWISVTPAATGSDLALQPTFDLLAQARSGLMDVTGELEGGPTKVGAPVADVVTGLYATVALVTGLYARLAGRPGRRFEVPLLESTMTALVNQAQGYLAAGVEPRRLGNDHPSIAPYGPVVTADGQLLLAVGTDAQYRALVDALGSPVLQARSEWLLNDQRVRDRVALTAALNEAMRSESTSHWLQALEAAGVPCAPIFSVAQAFSQPHVKDGDFLAPVKSDHGTYTTMRSPLRIDGVRPPIRSGPRAVGADQNLFED